jgi:hypothetical protein
MPSVLFFLLFAAVMLIVLAIGHGLIRWNRRMVKAIMAADTRLRKEIFPHLKVDGLARPKIEAILADLRSSL